MLKELLPEEEKLVDIECIEAKRREVWWNFQREILYKNCILISKNARSSRSIFSRNIIFIPCQAAYFFAIIFISLKLKLWINIQSWQSWLLPLTFKFFIELYLASIFKVIFTVTKKFEGITVFASYVYFVRVVFTFYAKLHVPINLSFYQKLSIIFLHFHPVPYCGDIIGRPATIHTIWFFLVTLSM